MRQLKELRMRSNPLNESDRETSIRQQVIARIGGLKMFNRSEIKSQERKGAEIDYMKKFGKEWLSYCEKKEENQAFIKQHPRYLTLVECL